MNPEKRINPLQKKEFLCCVSCGHPSHLHKLVHPWNTANGPRPTRCKLCSKVCMKKGKNYYFSNKQGKK